MLLTCESSVTWPACSKEEGEGDQGNLENAGTAWVERAGGGGGGSRVGCQGTWRSKGEHDGAALSAVVMYPLQL